MDNDVKPAVAPPVRAASGGSWLKRALWILLLLVLVGGAAYGAGWYPTNEKLKALEQTLSAERARSIFLEGQVKSLEAKLGLHLAIVDLTQQNYGLAKSRIARSTELLSGSPEVSLRTLADKLGQIKVEPGQSQQAIDALLQLSAGLDSTRPGMEAGTPPPALPSPPN
jgi:hypothetical protein